MSVSKSGPVYFDTMGFCENRRYPYSRNVAIYLGRCNDCEARPQWEFQPDADNPSWYGQCDCEGRDWSAVVATVGVTFYDD